MTSRLPSPLLQLPGAVGADGINRDVAAHYRDVLSLDPKVSGPADDWLGRLTAALDDLVGARLVVGQLAAGPPQRYEVVVAELLRHVGAERPRAGAGRVVSIAVDANADDRTGGERMDATKGATRR